MFTLPDYRLTEELLSNARYALWRGVSEKSGAPVLVKLLHQEYPALDDLERLRHEYEATKNLDVEGAVRPLELKPFRNGLALVLEDRGGVSLDVFMGDQPLGLAAFYTLAANLTVAVGQLHRHNIVHFSLEPRHILVHPPTLTVQLTGFGLSSLRPDDKVETLSPRSSTRSARPTMAEDGRENLLYIAPEQTGRTAQRVDLWADFYALGAIFYQMLTARAPFFSLDALEMMHAHIARTPVAPHEIDADIPVSLSHIVLKLLAKTPRERYGSASGLIFDLKTSRQLWRDKSARRFELGAHDFSDELRFSTRIYGREAETAQLLQAFERISQGATEMVLVSGYSGIGKSSLVREIASPVARRGYFVAGKFEQFRRDVPYAAVVQAFRTLVAQILTEDAAALGEWQARFARALGENGRVIVEVIPQIELIIGAQPEIDALAPREAQNRFLGVFQRFIQSFAAAQHPLVLFLDDLQWADSASLCMLRVLVAPHPENNFLLLIGAFRDNEITASHPLMLHIDEARDEGSRIEMLHLSALQPLPISQLVADVLRCDTARVEPLAQMIGEKTGGNPFFVHQVLQALWRDKLLVFEPLKGRWNWDLAQIRGAEITDNVVELVAGKIGFLSSASQRALTLAACLGNDFNVAELALTGEQDETETAAQVWEILRAGLLLRLPQGHFKFAHDRVQQAARSLMPRRDRQRLHLQIARMLLEKSETNNRTGSAAAGGETRNASLDERIFEIVGHFNQSLDMLGSKTERHRVLELNLRAGRRAKKATSYEAALSYLSVAAEILPDEAWQNDYKTTFALHRELAECAHLAGFGDRARQYFDLLERNAQGVLDRAEVVRTNIQLRTIQNDFTKAIELGLRALAQLGVTLPLVPSQIAIMREVMVARRLRGRRSIASLADAPHLKDAHQKAALEILSNLVAPLYVSGQQSLFILVVLKMTTISLRWGNADVSSQAYALYGVVLGSGLGDYESGFALGEMALKLSEQFANDDQRCKTMFTFPCYLSPWHKPLSFGESYFRQSYELGLKTGNTVFAGYGIVNATAYKALRGEVLSSVCQEIERFLPFLHWTKDRNQLAMTLFTRQMCRCLQGETRDESSLSDDEHDESLLLRGLLDNAAARLWYRIVKLKIFYLRGDYEAALEMAQLAESDLAPLFGTPYLVEEKFFLLLTLTALSSQSSTRLTAKRRSLLKKAFRQMKKWARHAPDCAHKFELVQAELARLRGQKETCALYQKAIRSAQQSGYVQDQALAQELAARFHEATGHKEIARAQRWHAHYNYLRWGATTKAHALENEFPELLHKTAQPNVMLEPSVPMTPRSATGTTLSLQKTVAVWPPSTLHTGTRHIGARAVVKDAPSASNLLLNTPRASRLDWASVVKTAQALSSETDLSRLMQSVMGYALENAGAQNGLLLLVKNGALLVQAQAARDSSIQVLQGAPLREDGEHPAEIVHYVARTRQNLVLQNASNSPLFAERPYVLKHRPLSVLCAPLLRQNSLIGVLYLENNLTVDAFTPERTEVLSVLAAQAAIALENALLLHDLRETTEHLRLSHEQLADANLNLEQKVQRRTEELGAKNTELENTLQQLTQMQNKLVMQENMASLGALTAGVAHEIKNPLNFVNNFALISAEMTNELLQQIEGAQNQAAPETSSHRVLDNASATLPNDLTQTVALVLRDLRENLSEINAHGRRADGIVNSMLRHSRAPVGQNAALEMADLNALIHGSLQLAFHAMRAQQSSFGLHIEENFAPQLGEIALAPQDISRVFLNLANNACYATHRRQQHARANVNTGANAYTPRLEVTTRDEQERVVIVFHDNGGGMPREIVEQIFKPFFTTKPAGEGTGLGLSMSYDIVTQIHGGEIYVETIDGESTTFTIVLPRRTIASQVVARVAAVSASVSDESTSDNSTKNVTPNIMSNITQIGVMRTNAAHKKGFGYRGDHRVLDGAPSIVPQLPETQ